MRSAEEADGDVSRGPSPFFAIPEDWLAFAPSRQSRSKSDRRSEATGADVKLPLLEHLDAILTSVGSKDQPGRFWSGEFFRQGDIDLPKLCRGTGNGERGGAGG